MKKPGILSKALNFYLKISSYRDKLDLDWWKNRADDSVPSEALRKEFSVTTDSHSKQTVWKISPKGGESKQQIVFLHGGGFSRGFFPFHWDFIAEMCRKLDQTVIAPDYPLLPHANADNILGFLLSFYAELTDDTPPENLTLIGDSSGGGLAHALCQEMVQKRIAQPAQLILLSPWLDVSLSNPLIEAAEDRDPLLNSAVLRELGKEYAGSFEINDPKVSPVYGKLRRITATTLLVGTNDLMQPDCRKLKIKAESEPVVFNYREFEGMFHNWMFFNLPEAKAARKMIVNQVRYSPSEVEPVLEESRDFWK